MFSMKEEGGYEIEDFEEQFTEIQKLLQGSIDPNDLADALLALQEFVKSSGKMQKSLLNKMILVHNDIFDTFSRNQQFEGEMRIQFRENLDFLEK